MRASAPGAPHASPVRTIAQRADFLACNKGRRQPMPGFVLLMRPREDGDATMRIGITVTKKIGNAVVRNRMKRRFRALARELLPTSGISGADHVLIGRSDGVEREYSKLRAELSKALSKITQAPLSRPGPRKPRK
jgi:ribonuclease P protein component